MAPRTVTDRLLGSIRANRVKAVSFDVFDTAITRPFFEPHDLFLLVERIVNRGANTQRGFADLRIEAEQVARERAWKTAGKQEITLDDIYDMLPEFGLSAAECRVYREVELAQEVASAYPINSMARAYAAIRGLGLPVIFTSDMYLPASVIEQMLSRCGYEAFTGLWLSSAVGKTKDSGDLFTEILAALKGNGVIDTASQLLHVGDNLHSDIQQAGRLGITTYHVQKPVEQFRRSAVSQGQLDEPFEPFASGPMRLERSAVLGMAVKGWLLQDETGETRPKVSAYDVGWHVLGPLLYGFADWLHRRCVEQKHGTVYFLARDGLILQRAFRLFTEAHNSNIKTAYVYASRRCCYVPAIEELDAGAEEILCRTWSTVPASEFITRLGLDVAAFRPDLEAVFGRTDALVTPDDTRPRTLFARIFDRIVPIIQEERRTLTAYLAETGIFEGTAAICDIGYRGSMQAAIKKLAHLHGKEIDLVGYYFATVPFPIWEELRTHGWICDQGVPGENWMALQESIAILELFFTAPHGTIVKIAEGKDGQFEPVMVVPCKDEEARFEIARNIQSGAMAFAQEMIASGLWPHIEIDPALALRNWISMVNNPSVDVLDIFRRATHNDGFGSSSFKPIVSPVGLSDMLFKPRATLEEFSKNNWRKGSLAASSHATKAAMKLEEKLRRFARRVKAA